MRAFGFNRPRQQGRNTTTTADGLGGDLHTFYYAWDASTDPGTVGYRLYVGRTSGGPYDYRGSPKEVGNVLDATFGVREAGAYYAVVKAVNATNDEGPPTNEIAQTWFPTP